MNKLLVLCAALALLSTQAQARCRDDIQDMKPRIDRIKNSEPQRYMLATRWWGRAVGGPGADLRWGGGGVRAGPGGLRRPARRDHRRRSPSSADRGIHRGAAAAWRERARVSNCDRGKQGARAFRSNPLCYWLPGRDSNPRPSG